MGMGRYRETGSHDAKKFGCSVSVVVGRREIERSRFQFPAGALPGSLGQLSLPSLWGR